MDIDLFLELVQIEASLASGSCTEALAWCGENRGSLKKTAVRPFLDRTCRTNLVMEPVRLTNIDEGKDARLTCFLTLFPFTANVAFYFLSFSNHFCFPSEPTRVLAPNAGIRRALSPPFDHASPGLSLSIPCPLVRNAYDRNQTLHGSFGV